MPVNKTRTKLVDVARLLFAKNGLENTTMNDIALASGKGRRTLYTYFKSKEEVYEAVIQTELDRLSGKLGEVAEMEMDLEDKLVEIIYTHLGLIKDAVQRNGNLRAEFFRNVFLVSKVRKNFDQNETRIFARILAEGVRTGQFDVDNIAFTADILHYSVRGLEIPYIHGRLADGLPGVISRAIVQKLIHKALGKQNPNNNYQY